MNPLLADWHAEVAINLAGDVLAARDSAGDAVVEALTGAQLLDLIALAYAQPGTTERGQWFRAAIKEHDPTFLLRGNDRETAVLAGACLWQVLDNDGPLTVLAGYGCAIAAFRDWTSIVPDLSGHAEHRLRELATGERELTGPPEVTRAQPWTKALQTGLATAAPDELDVTGSVARALIDKIMGPLQSAFDKVQQQQVAVAQWADHAIDVCAEETAQVGWLLSGASRTVGQPWSTLDRASAAVLAGRELADTTIRLPAPPHADAFLDQMLAATPFTDKPAATTVAALPVAEELAFLIAPLPNTTDEPGRLARHSLRQALLVQAWEQAP
jgi:hypothetical protein